MTQRKGIKSTAILSVIMFLTGISCSRVETETVPAPGGNIPISFSAGVEADGTKTLFTPDNFTRAGHQIAVFDVLDDGTFHIGSADSGSEGNPEIYESQGPGSRYWTAESGQAYYWTAIGTHNFFAFSTYYKGDGSNDEMDLEIDGMADEKNSEPYILLQDESKKWSMQLKNWTITIDKQLDFLYARHSRSMSSPDAHADVELNFRHLFAAVGFRVYNRTGINKYTVTNWHFYDLKNKATSVTIPFTDDGDIEMELESVGEQQMDYPVKDGYQRESAYKDGRYAILYTGEKPLGTSEYFVIWPHNYNQLSNVRFHIEYYPGDNDESSQEIDLNMGGENGDFDIKEWEAGKCYMYNIYISDSKVYFDVNIVPWKTDDVILD